MTNLRILFDNGGGITVMTADYCHFYDRPDWAADDVRAILGGADPADWDGNEPEFRREPHREDDVMTSSLAAAIHAGTDYPQRGHAWNEFCEILAAARAEYEDPTCLPPTATGELEARNA